MTDTAMTDIVATDTAATEIEVQTNPGAVQQRLTARREAGGKAVVPYVTAGITENWLDYVQACIDGGADAIEIGLPFSDPMLDGPIIQAASVQALARGVTVRGLLDELAGFSSPVPLIAMTYSNIVGRHGYADFCDRLVAAGVSGLIAPDTPVDEVAPLLQVSLAAGVELILLVAPSTRPDRVQRIAELGRGFIYAVSTMGVTGVRDSVSASVVPTVERVRGATNLPVLVGFGISTPEQAVEVSRVSDGVIVASALMRAVLEGASPDDIRSRVAAFRQALDEFEN